MRAIINRESFLRAYGAVSTVVPARSPKPVLQLIKATFGEFSSLEATDLEVGIRRDVWGVKAEEPGFVLLPQAFGQILNTSSDEELSLEINQDSLRVKGSHAEFTLPTEDPNLFPSVPSDMPEGLYAVSSLDLKRAIRRTIFATDVESTRYAMGGLLFEVAAESLSTVGTDGRRLAKQTVPIGHQNNPTLHRCPVVPVKALKLIDRNLPEGTTQIAFAFVAESIVVRAEHAVITSRLVEGRFPRYQDVFPATHASRIPIDAADLLTVTTQAAIATSDESRGIDFEFSKGTLTLSGKAEKGKSKVQMPIDHDEKAIVITFDPQYLIPALRAVGEQIVIIELIDSKSAAVLRTEDGYCYVVMPLTRESG